jgi:hypothetical protein
VVDGLRRDHPLIKKEIFLPFIAVAPVKDLEQTIVVGGDEPDDETGE